MSQYKIADLNIDFHGFEYDFFHQRMNAYSAIDFGQADISFSCCVCEDILLPMGKFYRKLHRWKWMETQEEKYAAFQLHPSTGKVVSLIECDRNLKMIDIKLCDIESEFGSTIAQRSFFTAGMMFYSILIKNSGLVLHSSAIDYKGNGILFSAPPETGKSTHTSLWEQYYPNTIIINDDTPAVRFIDDKLYAFGTPWSGKTEKNCNCFAPLRAIIFLEQSEQNTIRQVKGVEAVSLMLNETRKTIFPMLMDRNLITIGRILDSIPTYMLSCNKSKEAVDLVKNTLDL